MHRVFVCPFWATRASDSVSYCVQEAHRAKAWGRVGVRLLCRVRRLCVAVRNWAGRAQDFSERKMWPIWWTRRRRRTSPGLRRPEKHREHFAASLPSSQPHSHFLLAWHGRLDGERLASKSRQKRHVAASELRRLTEHTLSHSNYWHSSDICITLADMVTSSKAGGSNRTGGKARGICPSLHAVVEEDILSQVKQTRKARKGTGFVNVGDLPSDDEDRDTTWSEDSSYSVCRVAGGRWCAKTCGLRSLDAGAQAARGRYRMLQREEKLGEVACCVPDADRPAQMQGRQQLA